MSRGGKTTGTDIIKRAAWAAKVSRSRKPFRKGDQSAVEYEHDRVDISAAETAIADRLCPNCHTPIEIEIPCPGCGFTFRQLSSVTTSIAPRCPFYRRPPQMFSTSSLYYRNRSK